MKRALLLLLLSTLAHAQSDDFKYYYEEIYAPFFEAIPGHPGLVRAARRGANPSEFQAEKPAGVFRAMIVGGSTAGGYTGRGSLAWGLKQALPGRAVEVINCGMAGYDSDRERLVLGEAVRYQPDLVVVISGHNDFGIHRPPLSWWKRALAGSPLLARLRDALGVEPPRGEQMTPALRDEHLKRLAANLAADARIVKNAGAKILFVLPPADYEESAPDGFPPLADEDFARGWLAFTRGRFEDAARSWRSKDDGASRHALGRALERLGRRDEALAAYRDALDGAAGLDVCGPACLDAERAVARRSAAVFADADAAFVAASRPRLPGAELFSDEIHWSPARHALITNAILEALDLKPRTLAPDPDDESVHRRALLFYAVQRIDFRKGFSQRALEWLEAVDRLEPSWTSTPDALAARAAKVYAEYDDRRAGALYRSPLEKREVPRARLLGYWGAMRLEQGRFADARKALAEADRLEPRTGDFLELAGAAAALDGRADEARKSFARAAKRPQSAVLARLLGVTTN